MANTSEIKDRPAILLLLALFILYCTYLIIHQEPKKEELVSECPSQYYRREISYKEYKALLIKKNESGGEGMVKPMITRSIDLNNQGEILHIAVSKSISLDEVFDERFWAYVEVGDSIIKSMNSYQVKVIRDTTVSLISSISSSSNSSAYQVKVIRDTTVRVFDIDCEQYKKEIELLKNK